MIDFLLALFAFRYFPLVHAFAPFLAKCFFTLPLSRALALSGFLGFIMDLFTSGTSMGFHSANFLLTTLVVYKLKWIFSPHKAHGLFLFTVIYSLTSTLIYYPLHRLYGNPLPFSYSFDLLILPLFDGAYGFLWFSCPYIAYNFLKKHYLRYKHG